MTTQDNYANADQKNLARMGYEQELFRGFSAFSNYALSLSIICILAGGITSFHVGYCAVGPAAIGIGWPIALCFSLAVAAAMAQIASAFPTAGGLYHWGSLLGGRGCGWITAWFNLAGLVTVLAAINVGTWNFIESSIFGSADLGDFAQVIAVTLITFTQVVINLFGMRVVGPMTNFSGYWILGVSVTLIILLLAFGGPNHPERLFQFENFSGLPEGEQQVWPSSDSIAWLFFLAMLLPAYTITGFDGSAHAAEETLNAASAVPKAIMQAVLISGIVGYILLSVAVLVIDDTRQIANQGSRAFVANLEQSLPFWLHKPSFIAIVLAQYLCGMSVVTSASRMAYAFARDGGMPFSSRIKKVNPKTLVPENAIYFISVTSVLFTLYSHLYDTIAAAATILLYLSYMLPILAGFFVHGRSWKIMGPWHLGIWFKPLALLSTIASVGIVYIGIQPPNEKAGYAVLALTIFLVAFWFTFAKYHFKGPPITLKQLQENPNE